MLLCALVAGAANAQETGLDWLRANTQTDDPDVLQSLQEDFREDTVKNVDGGLVLTRVFGAQGELAGHFFFIKNFSDHDYCIRIYWPHGIVYEKRDLAQIAFVEKRQTGPIGQAVGMGAGGFGAGARFVTWKARTDAEPRRCSTILPEGVDWPGDPLT